MRAVINTYKKDGLKFELEIDMGGAPGGDYTVWICKDGKPYGRRFFEDKCSEVHFKRFAEKCIREPEYLEKWKAQSN